MTPLLLLLLCYTSVVTILFIVISWKLFSEYLGMEGNCLFVIEADEIGFIRFRCVICRKIKVIQRKRRSVDE